MNLQIILGCVFHTSLFLYHSILFTLITTPSKISSQLHYLHFKLWEWPYYSLIPLCENLIPLFMPFSLHKTYILRYYFIQFKPLYVLLLIHIDELSKFISTFKLLKVIMLSDSIALKTSLYLLHANVSCLIFTA